MTDVIHISVIIDSLHYCGMTGTDDDEKMSSTFLWSLTVYITVEWLVQMMMKMSSTFLWSLTVYITEWYD